jgi:hypothetical protein
MMMMMMMIMMMIQFSKNEIENRYYDAIFFHFVL